MIWRIFTRIRPALSQLLNRFLLPPPPNLLGDRDIEFSWVVANIPDGPGEALDFGPGKSYLALVAARKGFKVTALDLRPMTWYYKHPQLSFVQGDLFSTEFQPNHFDLIINCSSIEHVGLAGRYGVSKSYPDGDITAMKVLKGVLKPEKLMLLTIPVGKDQVINPLHRVYGADRLPKLLKGWDVLKEEYWAKNEDNTWVSVDKSLALSREPTDHYYNLGLFVLRYPK